MIRAIFGLGLVLLVFGGGLTLAAGQQPDPYPEDALHADQRARMQKARRDEAFDKMKEESDRLYKEATELKELLDKATPHTYSLEILKKIDRVEKALKDLRKRVKQGYQ
ncbi:MAG: hypothetical protein AB1898_12385 [Acidobacteriota bacterium]